MDMGDLKVRREVYTWANNREGKGFIQERLDRFCGSVEWMLENDTTEVTHVLRQTSDHSIIILDTKPTREKRRARFICETSWLKDQESELLVTETWKRPIEKSRIFKVKKKLKWCNLSLIKWKKKKRYNVRKDIDLVQKKKDGGNTGMRRG